MNMLQKAKQQRSELLQQLELLRIRIKDQAKIDRDKKWDLLQTLPPQDIKIVGLGRGFDKAILNSHEQDVYNNYKDNCLAFEKLISGFKAYYQTEDHKNIVSKIIKQVNDNQTNYRSDYVKSKLISNLRESKLKNLALI